MTSASAAWRARGAGARQIAGDVAHHRIQLGQGNADNGQVMTVF